MRDFIFHNPVKIYFGKGQARHIAQEVERVEAPFWWCMAADRLNATVPMTM